MKRDNLDLVKLSLIEPLLMRWTLLYFKQDRLKCRDATVLVFKRNTCLFLGLLLLNANVIAFNLLLQVLRVEILYCVYNVLFDILKLVDRIDLCDWRSVYVSFNIVAVTEFIFKYASLSLHLKHLNEESIHADFD